MAHTCCCTNQCKACGACCQFDCGHASNSGYTVTTPHLLPQPSPQPPLTWPAPIGSITFASPLTVEQVRQIVREELQRDRDLNKPPA